MSKKFRTGLSGSGFRRISRDIHQYRNDLADKCYDFAEKMAEAGIALAKLKISGYDAIETGELLNSLNMEPGDVVTNGASFVIYTGCDWAPYVEFGTGVIGSENPHPDTGLSNWKYDVNSHGESGWFYYKDGTWHWTKGMISRPFMYETGQELADKVVKIAHEVFGDD